MPLSILEKQDEVTAEEVGEEGYWMARLEVDEAMKWKSGKYFILYAQGAEGCGSDVG